MITQLCQTLRPQMMSFCIMFGGLPHAPVAPVPAPDAKKVALPVHPGGQVTEGFQLTIRPAQEKFQPVQAIEIDISLKNTTAAPLDALVSYPEIDYRLEVTDAKGEPLPLTRYGVRLRDGVKSFFGIGPLEVGGGSSLPAKLTVNRLYDMTIGQEYLVKVTRSIPKMDKKGTARIESNTIKVQVGENALPPVPPSP